MLKLRGQQRQERIEVAGDGAIVVSVIWLIPARVLGQAQVGLRLRQD
jgi:hypothetical protein